MRKKRNRRKRKLILLFFFCVVVVVVVAAVMALYQGQRNMPMPTAEEYFRVSDVTHEGFLSDDGRLYTLHRLVFNLTAVGGDAHYVIIQNLGPDPPSTYRPAYIELGTMLRGEVGKVTLSTEYGVYLHLEEEGFPAKVRITSLETSKDPQEQFITIYITQDESG